MDDLIKLLVLLDPRIVSALNLALAVYVIREVRRWEHIRGDERVRDATEQSNDRVRDDRVTQLATSLGAFANKVDALHARLDTMDKNNVIEMTKLTTELHFRLAALDSKLASMGNSS